MATWYGQTPGDVVTGDQDADGQPDVMAPGAVLTIWSRDKSTQIVELLDENENAITQVTANAKGRAIFAQPADNAGSVWGKDSDGEFWLFQPNFIDERITDTGTAAPAWDDITGKPSTFTPATHTHTASQISDSTATGRSLLSAASATAARTTLGAASTADVAAKYTKPAGGIPLADLSAEVITAITTAVAHGLADHTDVEGADGGSGLMLSPLSEGGYGFVPVPEPEGFVPVIYLNEGEAVPSGLPAGTEIHYQAGPGTQWGYGTFLGGAGNPNVQSRDITVPTAVPTGTLVLIGVAADAAGAVQATWSATDSKGNTYALAAQHIQGSSSQSALLYGTATTALTVGDTITVTSAQTRQQLAVAAFTVSGAATSSQLDRTATNGSTAFTATPSVGPTAITTATDEIAVGVFAFNSSAKTFTPGSGWSQAGSTQTSATTTSQRGVAIVYRLLTATDTPTATGTLDVAHSFSGALGTFRKA